ncbi:MAG: ABC transporter permease [Planctomycetes bacterium]|nr:ABC transporter permease [Planctomycetota bacterium]
MPLRLVPRNLLKHPLRSLLTLLSLAVALFLLCLLRSLVVALDAGVRGAKSDRVIVQSAVSLFVFLPESYQEKIRQVEGVAEVMGWTWFGGYYQEPANFFAQFATDSELLFSMYPEIQIIKGDARDFLADRRACIIGDQLASAYDFDIGQSIPLIGGLFPRVDGGVWDFQVAAIYRSNSSNVDRKSLFFHYDYLQQSREEGGVEGPPGIGVFVVKVKEGEDPLAVMGRIDALFENGPQRVQSCSEAVFQAQFVSMVGNIPLFVGSLGGGVFLAILLAVVNTMLMSAREQVRDIGIMKALGFTNAAAFWVILLQGLLLALAGGGLGILGAHAVSEPMAQALGAYFPGFAVSRETTVVGLVISLAIGVLAASVPAWRLSRLSTVQTMRMEA